MTGAALVLPVAVPLLGAGLLLAWPFRAGAYRGVALGVTAGMLALSVALLAPTRDGEVLVTRIGGWPAGIAISFAADAFSALMLTVTSVVVLCALVFTAGTGDDRRPQTAPLILVLSAGAYGAFLAADLFNLFVMVEMMLVPSYSLFCLGGGRGRIGAARVYVTVNLLASTLLLTGIGLLYGVTGEVRLAALAGAGGDSAAGALAGGVVLLALAVKAAVVPLHSWLPRSYPYAPPAMAALFSGVLTKVGIYVIFRIFAVLYDGDPRIRPLLIAAAVASMALGVLGAVGEHSMRAILSFHMVSQIGYLLLGLGLFSLAGLTAAIFYLVQYVLVKTALFFCAGAVRVGYGSDRLDRRGPLAGREPLLAVAFVGTALSLAGIPPFSGFVAKLLVIRAAALEGAYLPLTAAVAVSLLTLVSMLKIWNAVFWGEPPDAGPAGTLPVGVAPTSAAMPVPGAVRRGRALWRGRASWRRRVVPGPPDRRRLRPVLVVPAVALAGATLLLGLAAEPLLEIAAVAAGGLLDPSGYVRAVTGR